MVAAEFPFSWSESLLPRWNASRCNLDLFPFPLSSGRLDHRVPRLLDTVAQPIQMISINRPFSQISTDTPSSSLCSIFSVRIVTQRKSHSKQISHPRLLLSSFLYVTKRYHTFCSISTKYYFCPIIIDVMKRHIGV